MDFQQSLRGIVNSKSSAIDAAGEAAEMARHCNRCCRNRGEREIRRTRQSRGAAMPRPQRLSRFIFVASQVAGTHAARSKST